MANPLRDSFDFVIESADHWVQALRNPRAAVKSALRLPSRREKIRAATNLWFAAFFLSMIVSLPLYYGFGLKLENVSFQIAYVVGQYLIIAAVSALLHVGFRVYKIASRLTDTFVIMTVLWSIVMPFMTFFSLHNERRILANLSGSKQRGLSLSNVAATMFEPIQTPMGPIETIFSIVAAPLSAILGIVAVAMIVRAVAEHYHAPIQQTIRAFTFGVLVVAPVPVVLLVLLNIVLYYSFIA